MFDLSYLHPISVHFVIAPLFIAFVFDVLWLLYKKDFYEKVSFYNYLVVGVFGILAVLTGLVAEQEVHIPQSAITTFSNHENYAFIFIVFVIAVVLWRIGINGKIPKKFVMVYFIVALISILSAIYTGYHGGKLVFGHGVGVKTIETKENNTKLERENLPVIQFMLPDSSDQ